ncbi:MAG: DUF883 family protein [Propionivibrio sp.]
MKIPMTEHHETIQGSKEILRRDLRRIVEDADDLINAMTNATVEDFAIIRDRVRQKLDEARAKLDEAQTTVTRNVHAATDATRHYIKENPWEVLGIAAAVGLITAILVSYRQSRDERRL